jgi:hypothetical protein
MNVPELTADEIRRAIAQHFRSPERQAVIRSMSDLANFFEGWFTVETLFALRAKWPNARLSSNIHHGEFQKPDVVICEGSVSAVLALKHIATHHPDAVSRWDGAKGSTVAKDIEKFRQVAGNSTLRRVLVFHGPGQHSHSKDTRCKNWLRCIACSFEHLAARVSTGGTKLAEPAIEALLEDGTFHLVDFDV